MMLPLGRALIILGIALLLLGLMLTFSNLIPFGKLGRLPGDISFKKGSFSFYFPLTTNGMSLELAVRSISSQ